MTERNINSFILINVYSLILTWNRKRYRNSIEKFEIEIGSKACREN